LGELHVGLFTCMTYLAGKFLPGQMAAET